MLRVDIVENANEVQSRKVVNKETGAITIYYYQFGYVHIGGAFPVKIKLDIDSVAEQYPVGEYQITLNSFKVGRFDSLEVDNWNLKLKKKDLSK